MFYSEEQISKARSIDLRVFIEWLKAGKIEMRLYTEAPIHAKVYIMRKDPEKVPDTYGSVITGSSNFSEAGLLNNLEFNVELSITGYTGKEMMFDDLEFMAKCAEFTKAVNDSANNRNNASHGGTFISMNQCTYDKKTVLNDLETVRSSSIGLIQQLLYLLFKE